MDKPVRKIAFLGVRPHVGGTYTVFLNLREGLARQGIELRWVVAGYHNRFILQDESWTNDFEWGEVVAPNEKDDAAVAEALKDHLLEKYDGAIANVLCNRLSTNAVRYLPAEFPRIMLVHSISLGTYAAARSIRDYVHRTVGVSQRIVDDLVQGSGFNPAAITSIPNGIHVERFAPAQPEDSGCLSILVLSRMEHSSKGCFRVPEILRQLEKKGVRYRCTLAGDGPDLEEMKRRCEGLETNFLGRILAKEVPGVVGTNDAYLFPSGYEGFGLSLVEAMAGGCVPISSSIKGVTDRIIEDGVSGFLVETSDIKGYAEALQFCADNRDELKKMSGQARERACRLYSIEHVGEEFAELFNQLPERPAKEPLDLRRWKYPTGLRSGIRTLLPESVKNRLRLIREQLK